MRAFRSACLHHYLLAHTLRAPKQERTYDVVLLDVQMPVMDGLECIDKFREWEATHRGGCRQHVCALTAMQGGDTLATCMEKGMDEVVTKPLKKAQLGKLLARLLAHPACTTTETDAAHVCPPHAFSVSASPSSAAR